MDLVYLVNVACSRSYLAPDQGHASSRHHPAAASTDSQEAERQRSPDVRAFPTAGGSEIAFWNKTRGWKVAKWKLVLSRRGEVVAPKGAPSGRQESRLGSREKPLAVPLEAAAFGNVRGSFGSFRQFQLGPSTPSARCAPLPTPPGSFWDSPFCTRLQARVPHPSGLPFSLFPNPLFQSLPCIVLPDCRRRPSFLNSGARSTGRCEARGTR